jgi:hypothetical protein
MNTEQAKLAKSLILKNLAYVNNKNKTMNETFMYIASDHVTKNTDDINKIHQGYSGNSPHFIRDAINHEYDHREAQTNHLERLITQLEHLDTLNRRNPNYSSESDHVRLDQQKIFNEVRFSRMINDLLTHTDGEMSAEYTKLCNKRDRNLGIYNTVTSRLLQQIDQQKELDKEVAAAESELNENNNTQSESSTTTVDAQIESSSASGAQIGSSTHIGSSTISNVQAESTTPVQEGSIGQPSSESGLSSQPSSPSGSLIDDFADPSLEQPGYMDPED